MTNLQKFWLVFLRLAIGWHFLYEGIAKLVNPNWSSVSYLMDSGGFLKEFYFALASNPDVLKVVDFMNVWGLILIGLGLMLGALTRAAIISGMVLLAFYYFSHPPFTGIRYTLPSDGSFLIINKIFIEFVALGALLAFPTWKEFGLDRWLGVGGRAKGIGRRAKGEGRRAKGEGRRA